MGPTACDRTTRPTNLSYKRQLRVEIFRAIAATQLRGLASGTKPEQSGGVADRITFIAVSRPETTAAVTRGAARLLIDLGYAPLAEVTLPNGRRADLMALGRRGEIFIVEVKSSLEDFRTDQKWHEYQPYCDAFAFAVAPEFPREILPEEPGLIVADGFGGAVLREAAVAPLVGARRKALTLAFGRLAALRAAGVQAVTLE